jgi:hypothetical protein
MLDIKQLKKAIKKGADQNILVFDAEAEDGVVTSRLFALMRTVSRCNYKKSVNDFYVPYFAHMKLTKYRHNIYQHLELDTGGILLEYYLNDVKGRLVNCKNDNTGIEYQNDRYLIIGIGEDVVLLGSC